MAGPITWRNVSGPSLADASRPLEVANNTINSGFGALNSILNKTEATDQANWNQVKENNTQDFLNKLYAVQGADGFKALQQSGELDRMIAANGAQIDRAAARSAMDGRLGVLQNRDLATMDYTNKVLDNQQAPIMESLKVAAQRGDQKGFDAIVAANPNLRHLSGAYESMRKVGYEIADEAQKAIMRPLDVQAKKGSIQSTNLSNQTANINLEKLKLDAKDSAEVRALTNTLATAQQEHIARHNELGQRMGAVAAELKLPMTAAGHPDFDLMDSTQIKNFDAIAQYRGVPLSSEYMTGDTKAADSFYKNLVDSKQYTPATLAKYKDNIRGTFNSGATGSAVGNDAANKALANAQNKAAFDEMDADNWYAPGSANAVRNNKAIAEKIDGMFGANEKEDLPHVQKLITRLANEGLEVRTPDGKTMKVVPSENDILGAVRSTYEGWNIRNRGRAEDIEAELKRNLQTAAATKRLADGASSAAFRRKEAVKKILDAAK